MITEPFKIELEHASATLQFQVFEADGHLCCGLYKLQGKINLPPRAWLRTVRREMARIEGIAREAGCKEMRVAGRDWSRILLDYRPFKGPENGLRKVLN
jgi:hypothetical protein